MPGSAVPAPLLGRSTPWCHFLILKMLPALSLTPQAKQREADVLSTAAAEYAHTRAQQATPATIDENEVAGSPASTVPPLPPAMVRPSPGRPTPSEPNTLFPRPWAPHNPGFQTVVLPGSPKYVLYPRTSASAYRGEPGKIPVWKPGVWGAAAAT